MYGHVRDTNDREQLKCESPIGVAREFKADRETAKFLWKYASEASTKAQTCIQCVEKSEKGISNFIHYRWCDSRKDRCWTQKPISDIIYVYLISISLHSVSISWGFFLVNLCRFAHTHTLFCSSTMCVCVCGCITEWPKSVFLIFFIHYLFPL